MKYFVIIILFSGQTFCQIDSSHSGIIYGKDHAFAVKAPEGWVLDTKSGVNVGLYAVFYPVGSSWEKATSVLYCNTALKEVKGNETIEKVIDFDIINFKKSGAEITDGENIITSDSNKAFVKLFYDKKNKNYEAVAYIDEKKVVIFLVLSSSEKEDFDKSYSAFKDLVKSYWLVTDDVKIKDK